MEVRNIVALIERVIDGHSTAYTRGGGSVQCVVPCSALMELVKQLATARDCQAEELDFVRSRAAKLESAHRALELENLSLKDQLSRRPPMTCLSTPDCGLITIGGENREDVNRFLERIRNAEEEAETLRARCKDLHASLGWHLADDAAKRNGLFIPAQPGVRVTIEYPFPPLLMLERTD